MPAVSAPATILVTGASGFVAAHVIEVLIDQDFTVRGTVRKAGRGEYLKNLFGDKFEHVIVEDMVAPNAFDKAVVGVDAILHMASPVYFEMGDPDNLFLYCFALRNASSQVEMLWEDHRNDIGVSTFGDRPDLVKPNVNGMLNILRSAKDFGHTVKRVVVTSSQVAIGDDTQQVALDETQWNEFAVTTIKEQGADAHPGLKYCASKVLAERAAWQFAEDNKTTIGFDIVSINPPWIWGPVINEVADESALNFSMGVLLGGLDPKNKKAGEELIRKGENEKAGGQRFVIDAGTWSWQSVYDAVNEAPAVAGVPAGEPGAAKEWLGSGSAKFCEVIGKSAKEFYHPFADTIRSGLESGRARGLVGA